MYVVLWACGGCLVVEVKSGESFKVNIEGKYYCRISQASIGEIEKEKNTSSDVDEDTDDSSDDDEDSDEEEDTIKKEL
ncbi:unnamed protein product [Lactuca virosa]|uniref:Uncharacterized protein n=1 Tax=Lactuca virosa TaxID=75947 RepID=A0AAU9MIX0_9ASTR|nr:unnamed protein product [Lactuca virosa]